MAKTKTDWQSHIYYQIYPRSFYDSTGNGVGDLPGITQKLDYVADLGVDGIWISPFFKSPMKDYGYDVSDYRDIDPLFGNLDDFRTLLDKAHSLELKIIVDLVLSHTSDQHAWFTDKPDYYVWADTSKDTLPNNWVSLFGGPAWTWHEEREQFYLHNFLKEQPDLNYHNPDVQKEALEIIKFWLDFGVDGLRLDVINFCFHDKQLRNNPPRPKNLGAATQFEGDDPYSNQLHIYDKSQPEMFDFLRKIRALTDEYEDRVLIGEIGDDNPYELAAAYTEGADLLHTTYNPQMMAGKSKTLNQAIVQSPIESFQAQGTGHPAWAFSNHDVVRAASRWLRNSDGFSNDQNFSKMLIALLTCLHGTLFLYQGEELGLPEAKLTFDQLQDPWGKHLWPEWQGRDGCRTPMPWDNKTNADQWLPIPDTHKNLTVEAQENDNNSALNFTKQFLKWRKNQPALLNGEIEFLEETEDKIAFKRISDEQTLLCEFDLKTYEFSMTDL